MSRIEKKTWPKFFKEIKSGKKNFEVRLADWKCKPEDVLILREWNPKTKRYTGRKIEKKVTYVLKTKDLKFFSKKDIGKYGYQIIAFK
jgi:ASC-1-like (ASCH) protein